MQNGYGIVDDEGLRLFGLEADLIHHSPLLNAWLILLAFKSTQGSPKPRSYSMSLKSGARLRDLNSSRTDMLYLFLKIDRKHTTDR
jgi:hypothetical protein